MPPRARRLAGPFDTRASSVARRSAQTAGKWSPRLMTGPRSCGTRRPGRRSANPCSTRVRCIAQRSVQTANGRDRVDRQDCAGLDAVTGASIGRPMQHDSPLYSASFSADGARVLTRSNDWPSELSGHSTARLSDASTGAAIGQPLQHQGFINSASFSPDGKRVVTASLDKTARIWDAATGASIGKPFQHEGPVNSAAFSPDGKRVVTASKDNTARSGMREPCSMTMASAARRSAPMANGS